MVIFWGFFLEGGVFSVFVFVGYLFLVFSFRAIRKVFTFFCYGFFNCGFLGAGRIFVIFLEGMKDCMGEWVGASIIYVWTRVFWIAWLSWRRVLFLFFF